MTLLALAVFSIVGMALSLFGGGGAIILIPYLQAGLGMPVDQAALLSLVTIGINTGLQSVLDRHAIQWKAVTVFSLIAFPATVLSGTYLAPIVPDPVRMICFGVFTLSVAALMFFPLKPREGETQNIAGVCLSAAATGVLCGLVGVGGGIFIAPALCLFYRIPIKEAVKSSLAIVAVQSFTAMVAYIARGVRVDLSFSLVMLLMVGLGVVGGRRLKGLIPEQRLKQLFGFFLVGIGCWVILRP
jgi:hypothetical protein